MSVRRALTPLFPLLLPLLGLLGCAEKESTYHPLPPDRGVLDAAPPPDAPPPRKDTRYSLPDLYLQVDQPPPAPQKFSLTVAPPELRLTLGAFELTLRHDKLASKGVDIWRLQKGYELDSSGKRLHGGKPIITADSWELQFTAMVGNQGETAQTGGAAGHQRLSAAPTLTLDGKAVDLAAKATLQGLKAVLKQSSNLYLKGQTGAIARLQQTHTITHLGVELAQTITWQKPVWLKDGFVSMLPVVRQLGSEPISDTGAREPLWTAEDLSQAGFKIWRSNSREAHLWGKQSGVRAEVKLVAAKAPQTVFFFQNGAGQNTLTWDFAGWYTTAAAEVWSLTSRYAFKKTTKSGS